MRSLVAALLLSLLAARASADYALRGTLVTPDQVIENGVLLIHDTKIVAAGTNIAIPPQAIVIDTHGYVYPGLIDLHNHVTWNAHARWHPPQLTRNRYEWQAMPEYKAALDTPHRHIPEANLCDLERFGEVKALVGGVTSITGSLAKDCSRGLVRNLDFASGLGKELQYRVFPFELAPDVENGVRDALRAGTAVIMHLAEGADPSSRRELAMARAHQYLTPNTIIVHGVALTEDDFRELGNTGVGFVWSPRSNIELYGQTADVAAAKKYVTMAIAPDWSPSGSSGMIGELRYAAEWNAKQTTPVFTSRELVQMATSNAARLAHIADKVGRLEPGMYADYVVIRREATDAYEALIYAKPADVVVVAVNGRPLYGDEKLVSAINPSANIEVVKDVCGRPKALDMTDSDNGKGTSFSDTINTLTSEFAKVNVPLAAVTECP
ncbi:MAG TPA: amidohydrolase family protein [Thermoanaerobaculia bacterium]|nr:amidohydrolase family protein [Thermoanaerobaculia bacterium]